MKKIIVFSISFLFIGMLSGCASTHKQTADMENLYELEDLTQQNLNPRGPVIAKIRQQALRETALSIGAQGGLAKRSREINNILDSSEKQLSRVFNFAGLMLPNNVLPPVLEESDASLTLTSPDALNLSDHTYRIIKQARFVTAPPTWRDYLWLDYKKPPLPDTTLLPRNKQERDLWKKYVDIGFQQGLNQANNIYATSLASLKRDYEGMMLYRKLLTNHMVSEPFVDTASMGVTSNTDRTEMRINEQVLQITAVPHLDANSKQWKPVVIENNDRR